MSAHNDTAFLRMFMMILGALVAFTVVIFIVAHLIIGTVEEERGEDPRLRAVIAERIKPVGAVNVAAVGAAPEAPKSGAEIVAAACNACHGAGVLGAPKIGDKDAWSQRLAAQGGIDGLLKSAIAGKGGMPPKGGAMVSDDELRAAIQEMLDKSGVDVAAAAAPEAQSGPVEAVKEMAGSVVEGAKSMVAAVMPAPVSEAPAVDLVKGKSVYDSACFVCHGTGAAGAPKIGDKAAWAPRIAQGMDALVHSALNGKNAMPPKGGRMDIADDDVRAGVAYLVNQSE
ncbi:MAG: c-type cytochrome [Chromatiaceae bacterium]|nr:c-type cytochrome [Chromatiaceae bacterium]